MIYRRKTDVFGEALHNYYFHGEASRVLLHNTYGEPERYSLKAYFKSESDLSDLEIFCMDQCRGKILDIGSGTGTHTLYLQNRGHDVHALEISDYCVSIMKDRGVKNIINKDIFDFDGDKYDTLLLLMNGIGISGNLDGFRKLLHKFSILLNPGGRVLFDSTDVTYLYHKVPVPLDHYFGELSFQFEYNGKFGRWFDWLYIDSHKIKSTVDNQIWNSNVIFEDGQDSFLMMLVKSEIFITEER
jgi:SAM-dependent methyltransferase